MDAILEGNREQEMRCNLVKHVLVPLVCILPKQSMQTCLSHELNRLLFWIATRQFQSGNNDVQVAVYGRVGRLNSTVNDILITFDQSFQVFSDVCMVYINRIVQDIGFWKGRYRTEAELS